MLESLVLAGVFLTSGQQPSTRADCRPAVMERAAPARNATASYYDQARDSVVAIHPRHRLLAERRAGMLGRVEYSLVAYAPDVSAAVSISALAVDWEARRAWSVANSCAIDAWPGGLIGTLTAIAAGSSAPAASEEAVLIEAARSTVARKIDPLLPAMSLDGWLASLVGSQARMQWELNDCGEQTGNPAVDRGRIFPRCAEVRADLSGNRSLFITLSVGSQQNRPAGTPSYHAGVLIEADRIPREIRRLADVGSALKTR